MPVEEDTRGVEQEGGNQPVPVEGSRQDLMEEEVGSFPLGSCEYIRVLLEEGGGRLPEMQGEEQLPLYLVKSFVD